MIINKTYTNLDAKIQEYILKRKKIVIANKNLQITLKNKSKSLYIVSDIFYYIRISLIFYNNKTETISNIIIKDARSTRLKQELNTIDNKFKFKLAK